jgi:hypothetical protein
VPPPVAQIISQYAGRLPPAELIRQATACRESGLPVMYGTRLWTTFLSGADLNRLCHGSHRQLRIVPGPRPGDSDELSAALQDMRNWTGDVDPDAMCLLSYERVTDGVVFGQLLAIAVPDGFRAKGGTDAAHWPLQHVGSTVPFKRLMSAKEPVCGLFAFTEVFGAVRKKKEITTAAESCGGLGICAVLP